MLHCVLALALTEWGASHALLSVRACHIRKVADQTCHAAPRGAQMHLRRNGRHNPSVSSWERLGFADRPWPVHRVNSPAWNDELRDRAHQCLPGSFRTRAPRFRTRALRPSEHLPPYGRYRMLALREVYEGITGAIPPLVSIEPGLTDACGAWHSMPPSCRDDASWNAAARLTDGPSRPPQALAS